jgi:transposase
MIDYEQFVHIKKLHDQLGLNAAQIARYLNLDARTVAKWLEMPRFKPRQPSPRTSKLEPFKPDIARILDSFNYSAAQIWQRLRQMGFDGGYTIVKDYLRQTRPKPAKAFLTLAFAPGQCAQVDWGNYKQIHVGTTRRNLSFFVMVLAHSRMLYLEFTVMQMEGWLLSASQSPLIGSKLRTHRWMGGDRRRGQVSIDAASEPMPR